MRILTFAATAALGLFAATEAQPFRDWPVAAERFGVQPMTVEEYLQRGETG